MMDILVTFEDGTTELRGADSYVHWLHPWKLTGRGITRAERVDIASGRAAGLWQMRGAPMATVWRTTWDHETKVLTGAWASCRVETMAEQIGRLTEERSAAELITKTLVREARQLVANAEEMERRIAAVEAVRDRAKALRERMRGQDGEHTAMINQRAWESAVRILRGTQEDPSSLLGMGA